jgi:type IV pilus assembly protein PilC
MFSSRLPLKVLIPWCRALRHGVDIGLPLPRIFRQQAKTGPTSARELAIAMAKRLDDGQSLQEAMRPDVHKFPVLFVEMVGMGEKSGRLTEIFETLESTYETALSARKKFLQALIWPAISYFAAIFIIAAMLLVLGLIAPSGGKGFDPLGFGLLGPKGAMIWLLGCGMFTAAVILTVKFIEGNDKIRAKFEAVALKLPGLQGCFRAFALQRFSLGLHMTGEAGMKADNGLQLTFRATANNAYLAHADRCAKAVQRGDEIAPTLASCGSDLFPVEYIDALTVGEVSGRLPEVMAKQAVQYQEEAARKSKTLAMIAGGVVYGGVVLMLLVLIVRMLMGIAGVYQDAMSGL